MTLVVYRFEDSVGRGPFSTDHSRYYDDHHKCRERRHSCRHMPSPWSDYVDGRFSKYTEAYSELYQLCQRPDWTKKILNEYRFAFTTIEQIKLAFPSGIGRVAMQQYGGQCLNVYGVDPDYVVQGYYQCAFKPEYAQLIGELDMKTLRPLEGVTL